MDETKKRIVMDVPGNVDKLIEVISERTGTNKTSVYKILIDLWLRLYEKTPSLIDNNEKR